MTHFKAYTFLCKSLLCPCFFAPSMPSSIWIPAALKKNQTQAVTLEFDITFSRGRTRTYDPRVMSPMSCQLLYPASIVLLHYPA